MSRKKINSKIFKLLMVTTLLSPTIFFQVACQQKDNKLPEEKGEKDGKKAEFEKEINSLKAKIRFLEDTKNDLNEQLKPFNELMTKHKVDSFDGLMGKLLDVNDRELLEKSLVFANCLLETETMTLKNLQLKLNDEQWKNKNKNVLETLLLPFSLKREDFTSNFTIDDKVVSLAEKISRINDSSYIKDIKKKIEEKTEQYDKVKNKLISCYLAQLADEKYIDWENFVKQFNVQAWKNDKKNKPTIENLLPLLNCSIEDLDANKINDLDEQITNDAQKFIKKWKDIINEFKTKITELESELNGLKDKLEILKNDKDKDWNKLQDEKTKLVKELSEKNDELISYYIARLVDENYIDWENFIKQFDSKEWKENGKRQPTIKSLIGLLNCSINELNANKINGLGEKIVGEAKRLINEYLEPINRLKGEIDGLQDKNKKCKKQLISYYLFQLADKDHTNWDDFVKQFNDKTWKNVLGRSPFTEKLAEELDCSIDDLDTNKINNLDKEIIDETKRLINKYLEPINDFEKKINELQDKNKEYEKQLISCYLAQLTLTDKDYTNWEDFVQKFNDPTWKNSEENKATIENLIGLLNCTIEELNANKINSLDGETITSINKFIDIYQKPIKELKSQINEREGKLPTLNKGDKDYDKVKNELISCYIALLADEKYTDWDNFVKQFNDQEWKNSNKKQSTIKKLAEHLNCSIEQLDANKINGLDEETKSYARSLIKEYTDSLKDLSNKTTNLESSNDQYKKDREKLISYYLFQLADKDHTNWDDFVKQFDNPTWKENNENKPIITNLTTLLNCLVNELNASKINSLGKEIIDEAQQLINKYLVPINDFQRQISELQDKNKQYEKQLISCYFAQLTDEKYIDWENFIKQFNDQTWKNSDKRQSTIKKLAEHLNCTIDELNTSKINSLDGETIDSIKEFIDIYQKPIKGLKSRTDGLEKQHTMKSDGLIIYCLVQLADKDHTNWDDFVKQFDDKTWKNNKENKPAIAELVERLNCFDHQLNADKINSLNPETIDIAKKLIKQKTSLESDLLIYGLAQVLWDGDYGTWEALVERFDLNNKKYKADKNKLISYYLCYLAKLMGKDYTNWEDFVQKFNDPTWKNSEENKPTIENLIWLLNCKIEELNTSKISGLDENVINDAKELINNYDLNDLSTEITNLENSTSQNENKLISYYLCYLAKLMGKDYTNWEDFVQKFNDPTWKNSEENKPTIENLIGLLNCKIEELNANKINRLDGETIGSIKEFIDIYQKPIKELESRIDELESKLPTLKEGDKDYDEVKNELISCYLALLLLVDERHTDWDNFINEFNDPTWKNSYKKQLEIKKIAQYLNCPIEQLDADKINGLDEKVINDAQELIEDYILKVLNTKILNIENSISQYENKPTIKSLIRLLNCSIEDLNANKINNLDEKIINEVKQLLEINQSRIENLKIYNESKEAKLRADINNLWANIHLLNTEIDSLKKNDKFFKDLMNEYKVDNLIDLRAVIAQKIEKFNNVDTFYTLADTAINVIDMCKIDNPEFANMSYEDLQHESLPEFYENLNTKFVDSLIIYSLSNVYTAASDNSNESWYAFAKKFDDQEWKKNNIKYIKFLSHALKFESSDQINSSVMSKTLDSQKIQDEVTKTPSSSSSERANYIEQFKNHAISCMLAKLWSPYVDNWETFIQKFSNQDWKDKHQNIITFLSQIEIDIENLPDTIKKEVDGIIQQMEQEEKSLESKDWKQKAKRDIWHLLAFFNVDDVSSLVKKLDVLIDLLKRLFETKNDFWVVTRNLSIELNKDAYNLSSHDLESTITDIAPHQFLKHSENEEEE